MDICKCVREKERKKIVDGVNIIVVHTDVDADTNLVQKKPVASNRGLDATCLSS